MFIKSLNHCLDLLCAEGKWVTLLYQHVLLHYVPNFYDRIKGILS